MTDSSIEMANPEASLNGGSSLDRYFRHYPGLDNAYVITVVGGKTYSGTVIYQDEEGIILSYFKQHTFTVWINRDNICSISGIVSPDQIPGGRSSFNSTLPPRRRHSEASTKPFYMDDPETEVGADDSERDESE